MFIVDAFIGNWDRHNGNWGFLYDTNTDEVTLAPVYDCGSSLYPQADEEMMHEILNNKNELNHRVFYIYSLCFPACLLIRMPCQSEADNSEFEHLQKRYFPVSYSFENFWRQ